MTLAEFVLARRAEVEATARDATLGPWRWVDPGWPKIKLALVGEGGSIALLAAQADAYPSTFDAAHIVRHDPDRVLRRVEADRQIVALHHPLEYRGPGDPPGCAVCSWRDDQDELHGDWPCPTLRLLGVVDDDHPDYRPEWRP
jgi:hypothetical protein